MKKQLATAFDTIQALFLKIFGDIKYHPWPLFFIYDPKGYQVKGYEVRDVLNTVQPGDILLRGYEKYLSGLFIPGYFSHAGLYLGEVNEEERENIKQDFSPGQLKHFGTGSQMVVHAMAQGVYMEDLIDFCRCDRLIILRFPEVLHEMPEYKQQDIHPMEEVFSIQEYNLYRDLKAGKSIRFTDAFRVIYQTAIEQIGRPYDFKFNFENYNDLSCTEYVQSCIKSLGPFHGINAIEKRYFGLFKKRVIEPDNFFRDCFDVVWKSESADLSKVSRPAKPKQDHPDAAYV